MQVFAQIIAFAFLPVLTARPPGIVPGIWTPHQEGEICARHPVATDTWEPLATPPLENWTKQAASAAPSSPTAPFASAIKQRHPLSAHCGLCGCATVRTANPLTFVMQVFAQIIAFAFLPVLTARPPGIVPGIWTPHQEGEICARHPVATDTWEPLATPPLENWTKQAASAAPSSPTAPFASAIKQRHPLSAHCGLCGCATVRTANPLTFVMQVGVPYTLFAKKSSNYCLVQLPSPQCCFCLAVECVNVIRALLLLSGDVETNPGPPNTDAVLAELQKLSTGQRKLISEVQGLKNQLVTTDKTISALSERIANLETQFEVISTLRTEIETLQTSTARTTHQLSEIDTRLDDLENRSRRNNLVFYGLPDPNEKESYDQSEKIIIQHCLDSLNLVIDPKDIERAHRLGRHSIDRHRPIIVKLSAFKTKGVILSNGPKLKNTDFSIGEDFSRPVRNARKHLVAFARTKSGPFSLRYKTLHMGPKRYMFDQDTQTVKEIA
ncbi:uncharacterized protein LOC144116110 [Amblyomma americanum]